MLWDLRELFLGWISSSLFSWIKSQCNSRKITICLINLAYGGLSIQGINFRKFLFLVFPRSYHVCGTTSIAFTTANVSLTTTQAPVTQSISAGMEQIFSLIFLWINSPKLVSLCNSHLPIQPTSILSATSAWLVQENSALSMQSSQFSLSVFTNAYE